MDKKLAILRWLCVALCLGILTSVAACDALSGPPALEWPGPHAPYPFPNDVPHRTS